MHAVKCTTAKKDSFSCNPALGGAFVGVMMETEVYESVVREHKDRVFSYAVWMLREREDARDVAQEALIRLWKHRDQVKPASARAWLLTTTHRLCLDRLRHRKRWQELPLDVPGAEQATREASPERLAAAYEAVSEVGRALGELGPQDRAVVVLREIEGLGYREIAESLDIPLGTLKARLHRARLRLRHQLIDAGVTP